MQEVNIHMYVREL